MMKTKDINNPKTLTVRLDAETYSKIMKVLDEIGLDFSSAVRIYVRQIIREQGLPFKPGIIEEAGNHHNLSRY